MTIIIVVTTSNNGSGRTWDTSPLTRHILETLVGLFMFGLGGSTLFMAVQKRRRMEKGLKSFLSNTTHSTSSTFDGYRTDESSGSEQECTPLITNSSLDTDHPSYQSTDDHQIEVDFRISSSSNSCCHHEELHKDEESQLVSRCLESTLRTVAPCGCQNLTISSDSFSGRTVAFIVGLIHGVAGPGGILAVIPAMHLHNWRLASIYLFCFCLTSTLTMGIFASIYGFCSKALSSTSAEFPMACFSSFLSIAVGITWLTLLSLGKLDEVFD
jgi:hypothetical protein